MASIPIANAARPELHHEFCHQENVRPRRFTFAFLTFGEAAALPSATREIFTLAGCPAVGDTEAGAAVQPACQIPDAMHAMDVVVGRELAAATDKFTVAFIWLDERVREVGFGVSEKSGTTMVTATVVVAPK